MKRLFAILLTLAMLLSLAACGGSTEEDPNAGKYLGTTAKALGMTMEMSEVYPGETWLELKSGGKGTIMLDGDDFSMKWTLEGEAITITIDGVDSVGTLADGVITVDLMNMGVEMSFLKEGAEAPVAAATYNDAGYYDLIRIDGTTEEDSVSEEDLTMLREMGMYMYLELLGDGTGMLFMDEEMPVAWSDGTVNFTEDDLSISYTLEGDTLTLDMLESVLVFRKGEKPVATEPVETEPPVVSEMEQAGFVNFMEVGVPYAYTTCTSDDLNIPTIGEATVTSYEIFESAEGYAAEEGYEWRVVKMEVRFYDENTGKYGCSIQPNFNDYYNAALFDDTSEVVKETDSYEAYAATVIHNGQEADVYVYWNYLQWSDWYTGAAGNDEIICYLQWDFLVPVGYDGCVAGLHDYSLEWADGTYITDYDPADFLLFRLN